MGLFSSKPTTKNIQKQVAKVKERYAQPDYRRMAMEKLLEWGTPEAIDGVLERFAVVAQSPHWDEEEKRWLVEEMVERGDLAKEALIRFLKNANNIAFAAKALNRLMSADEYSTALSNALSEREPEDHRSAQSKQELIACLGDCEGDHSAVIIPHLDDHADDVQCTAVDVVENKKLSGAYSRLVEMLSEDLHSGRVLRHVAQAVQNLGISIDPSKALESAVTEDFIVKEGKLERRSFD